MNLGTVGHFLILDEVEGILKVTKVTASCIGIDVK
jgi:hypothetical protein